VPDTSTKPATIAPTAASSGTHNAADSTIAQPPIARRPVIAPPARTLLIRPSALGDVCRTVHVAAGLKRTYPNSELHWLVNAGIEDAVSAHPAVDRVIPFPRRALGKASRRLRFDRVVSWLNDLRRERYDLVVDAQGLGRSGGIAWWTQARVRVGFQDAREGGWLGCTHRVTVPDSITHTVDRMMALAAHIGVDPAIDPVRDMRLYAPDEAIAWAYSVEGPSGGTGTAGLRYAVVAPTSLWPAKQWRIERFADLVAVLADAPELDRVVVVGAPSERDACMPLFERFGGDDRVVDLVGATNIGQLLATIAESQLVVANDSAAAHIAVGFDRPLVALFGPTDTARVGPYARTHDVIQHAHKGTADGHHAHRPSHKDPANRAMMDRITVDEVVDACRARLSNPAISRGGVQNPA
jgi:heptosyltransferase-1